MKQNSYYVLFFFLLFLVNEYNVLCLRRTASGSGNKQIYAQEVIVEPNKFEKEGVEEKPLDMISEGKKEVTTTIVTKTTKTETVPEIKKESKGNKGKNDEASSVEFTLPEIEIDPSKKIDFYYPYLYKTHIIEYQDVIDYKELTNDCRDLGCQWCDNETKMTCSECRHGFFLFENKCYGSCPDNYVADIFKKKCMPSTDNNSISHIVYLKAFTVGSCKNLCGGQSVDCDCSPSCASKGNCCSDYQDCENLLVSNNNRKQECSKSVDNCELCSFPKFPQTGKVECSKCAPGFYLRNGECVKQCFPSDKLVLPNKVCKKNQDCRVDNCNECIDGNPSVCKKCLNGFFMHNNQCLQSCPINFRADRISWVCLEAPVFAWYWIFPSLTSCSKRCGVIIEKDMDCSCSDDCFRYGNCCQDIEDYCPELLFWK